MQKEHFGHAIINIVEAHKQAYMGIIKHGHDDHIQGLGPWLQ